MKGGGTAREDGAARLRDQASEMRCAVSIEARRLLLGGRRGIGSLRRIEGVF